MCTVLLRWSPGTAWPVLLGAVRDEFADRAWDPPGRHWDLPAGDGTRRVVVGGRDRAAGGTWLAVDPDRPAVAAVLNGPRLPAPPGGGRPSRGGLPLAALRGGFVADPAALSGFDGFHLLHATPARAEVVSWDGGTVRRREVSPGDHILVNEGLDVAADPLVPYFLPLLRKAGTPDPHPGRDGGVAWGDWVPLLAGDGLARDDPRALVIRVPVAGRTFASTSACLVALGDGAVRFDFSATPGPGARWYEVPLS